MKCIKLAVAVMTAAMVFSGCERDASGTQKKANQKKTEEVTVVAVPDPAAGGMKVEPAGGELEAMRYVRISFPVDMVDQSDVGKSRVSPVEVVPDGMVKFIWTSTRGGILETRMRDNAKVMRRLRLIDGLVDFSGKPVDVDGWGAEFAKQDLEVLSVVFADEDGEFSEPNPNRKLGGGQRVALSFSRDVMPSEIAKSLAFIDSETKQRFGVKVALEQEQADRPQGIVIVEPMATLPVERSYWLVIERLGDYAGKHPLPHLRVFPAGRTSPLLLTWARAYSQPLTGNFIRLGFNRRVAMDSVKDGLIRIDPPVQIAKIEREKNSLIVRGEFKSDTVYSVTVRKGISSEDGSPLAEEKTIELELPLRRPAIVLDAAKRSVPVAEFDFGLKLCRTQDVKWRIAPVPRGKYREVNERLKEFAWFARDDEGAPILDPRDETVRYVDTESLISSLRLNAVAEGSVKGEPGEELAGRSFAWPQACVKSGLYLVEFEGRDEDRREIGNRCLVNVRDMVIRKYAAEGETFFHVAQGANGAPLAGASLYLYGGSDEEPTPVMTNEVGFASADGAYASYLFVEKDGVTAFHEIVGASDAQANFTGGMPVPEQVLITNGDVFRPGDTVTYSGIVRQLGEDGKPVIPSEKATLSVSNDSFSDTGFFPKIGEVMNQIGIDLDRYGMFGGEFVIPEHALSGTYILSLTCGTYENSYSGEIPITVADFRKPDVLLGISAPDTVGDKAEAILTSEYFHGAPQAGAKVSWRAEWVSSDWAKDRLDDEEGYNDWDAYSFDDKFSPDAADQGIEGILSAMRAKVADAAWYYEEAATETPVFAIERGEGVLDEMGMLKVTTTCPFNKQSGIRRAQVLWVVEVLGEAGEVNRQVAVQGLQFAEQVLGLRVEEAWEVGIDIDLKSLTMDQEEGFPIPASIEVMKREVKVTKESVGQNIVRYRNTPVFQSIYQGEMLTNGKMTVPVREPGDYVVIAKAKDMPGVNAVSAQVIGLMNESQAPVLDDFSAEAIPERAKWTAGEDAVIQLRSPLTGWAHVTVEAGKNIDILPLVKITGTADKIKVPMKASYFPNCFVTIHVYQDAAKGGRPMERRAICELKVSDPQRELKVTPVLTSPTVAPRDQVDAVIRVSAFDRPVANARVVVGVIDESLLSLGEWKMPDPISSIHPRRPRVFDTARSLDESWYPFERRTLSQTQKGFILGDGGATGAGLGALAVRENDIPRPFWQSDGMTDAEGNFAFSFHAPDQLTSYRVFAVAVSGVESAGSGATKLRVSQDLRLKPFLPRFVREGDRLKLRCRIECDASADGAMDVEFRADAESGAILAGEASAKVRIAPGASEVVSVPVVIDEMTAGGEAVVLFSAQGREGFRDMVRVRIPVKDAHVLRTEHRGGTL
ncbi:MAG: alpha-2-macroglobulin family protein, partial [Luteolibacter sp.]